MSLLNRILIAGDGTLLVADQTLTAALPVSEVLAAEHPLRLVAEAVLAGEQVAADVPVRIRRARAPRGQLSAIELTLLEPGAEPVAPLPLGGWVYPAEPGTPSWSPDLAAVQGPDPDASATSLLLPDVPVFLSGIRELFRTGRSLRDLRLVGRDTEAIRTVRLYGWLPDPEPGTPPIGVTVDITDLTSGAEESGRFFEALISVAPDTVMVLDVVRRELLWTNRRLATQLGYQPGRLSRFSEIRRAVHWADRERLDELINQAGADLTVREQQFRIRDAAGRWRWMHLWLTPWLSGPGSDEQAETVEQIVCTLRDVDEAVRAEQRLQWEARHDPLTGLANRRVIAETLQRVSDDLDDERRYVYFLDLDDFKKVNDALGHSAGDELLRTLAARITVLVDAGDVVGRFGGDELIVVSSTEPERLAPRLLAAVHGRTVLAGSEFTVSCSVGVATVGAAEVPGDVIRRSNDAMYRAKRG
ncbi:MAG TPA: sensor domain-containing diguanylate cyclase, partial [Jatrophihabitans sp.]|nr:sensor domain-containing diguanylate cyclase [Jatrophihabitans sp.]